MMACSSSSNEMGVLRLIIVPIRITEPMKPVVAQETYIALKALIFFSRLYRASLMEMRRSFISRGSGFFWLEMIFGLLGQQMIGTVLQHLLFLCSFSNFVM